MKKIIILLLMVSILPLAMSGGDKFWIHASDGSSYINGTDICVDVYGVNKCFSNIAAGDNSSWNESYADTLYYSITNPSGFYNSSDFSIGDYYTAVEVLAFGYYNSSDFVITDYYLKSNPANYWNDTYATFNKTYADGLYITQGNEENLNVNSSDYWDTYNTANTTWFENLAGVLSLKLSELTSWADSWIGTKTTDDLIEGSNNFYDNSSWNESYASGLYYGIDNPSGFYNSTDFNISNYYNSTETDIAIETANTSMKGYVDIQDIAYNTTQTNYVDSKLTTVYYNASAIQVVTGTGQGIISDLQSHGDDSYNVSEVGSDFDLRVNFTGVTNFNQVIYRYKTEIAEPHILHVWVWDYDSEDWGSLAEEGARENFGIFTYPILCGCNHSAGGIVQLKFEVDGGLPAKTHKWQFDWIAISDGPATPSGSESDPFSLRKDGTTPLTGNWDAGDFNITAQYFLGNGSHLNVNSSDYWDNLNTINTTQMEDNSGTLNIKEGWLTTLWNSIFGTKTTDDLTEGSNNFYDNSSWNETYADTLYYSITNPSGFYNSSDFSISDYYTSIVIDGFNYWNDTYATFNKTYADGLYADISIDGTVTNISTTFPLSGGDITTTGTISITNDGIGDTQLEYNTGQHLTTTSNPTFNNQTITDCIIFSSGGKICSGS